VRPRATPSDGPHGHGPKLAGRRSGQFKKPQLGLAHQAETRFARSLYVQWMSRQEPIRAVAHSSHGVVLSAHEKGGSSGWIYPQKKPTSRPVSRVLSGGSPLRDGHSSGTAIAGRLEQPTRVAGLETRLAPQACHLRARPPLFGLAPGGVCRAAPVARRAVRSYRTLSPLPRGSGEPPSAVCFLWHFPWGRPRRPLAATVFPWSPDFPPPMLRSPQSEITGSGRPAGWCS